MELWLGNFRWKRRYCHTAQRRVYVRALPVCVQRPPGLPSSIAGSPTFLLPPSFSPPFQPTLTTTQPTTHAHRQPVSPPPLPRCRHGSPPHLPPARPYPSPLFPPALVPLPRPPGVPVHGRAVRGHPLLPTGLHPTTAPRRRHPRQGTILLGGGGLSALNTVGFGWSREGGEGVKGRPGRDGRWECLRISMHARPHTASFCSSPFPRLMPCIPSMSGWA